MGALFLVLEQFLLSFGLHFYFCLLLLSEYIITCFLISILHVVLVSFVFFFNGGNGGVLLVLRTTLLSLHFGHLKNALPLQHCLIVLDVEFCGLYMIC
ncbi:hypothetical protein Taro_027005 [Colocasia esculenta]|uniref:Uncharacterized protein n=1 Tax=Colocasia esculenta TaxID=4460 RepID=A0A843V7L4_COLES|nr:hypothetical protein [Colocasia esculenta]